MSEFDCTDGKLKEKKKKRFRFTYDQKFKKNTYKTNVTNFRLFYAVTITFKILQFKVEDFLC